MSSLESRKTASAQLKHLAGKRIESLGEQLPDTFQSIGDAAHAVIYRLLVARNRTLSEMRGD